MDTEPAGTSYEEQGSNTEEEFLTHETSNEPPSSDSVGQETNASAENRVEFNTQKAEFGQLAQTIIFKFGKEIDDKLNSLDSQSREKYRQEHPDENALWSIYSLSIRPDTNPDTPQRIKLDPALEYEFEGEKYTLTHITGISGESVICDFVKTSGLQARSEPIPVNRDLIIQKMMIVDKDAILRGLPPEPRSVVELQISYFENGDEIRNDYSPEKINKIIMEGSTSISLLNTDDIKAFIAKRREGNITAEQEEKLKRLEEVCNGKNIINEEIFMDLLDVDGISPESIPQEISVLKQRIENINRNPNLSPDDKERLGELGGKIEFLERINARAFNLVHEYFEGLQNGTGNAEQNKAIVEAIRNADPVTLIKTLIPDGSDTSENIDKKRKNYKEMIDKGAGFILLAALLAFSEGFSAISRSEVV